MSINIPTQILGLKGQCVNQIHHDPTQNILTIKCKRDKRFKPKDPDNKKPASVNSYMRRIIHDLPLLNFQVQIEIELVQVLTKENKRRIEFCEFVDKGS